MEYCAALMKKKETLSHAVTLMSLKHIMLSEIKIMYDCTHVKYLK